MPTKWYWVIHGRLTSEHKAYTSHRHSITRPLPAARALKHQAPCLMHEHSTGSERVDALGRRAVEVIICMITRDFSVISNDVTGVSLSLPLTKVTHTQYRKRFRASYNNAATEQRNFGCFYRYLLFSLRWSRNLLREDDGYGIAVCIWSC